MFLLLCLGSPLSYQHVKLPHRLYEGPRGAGFHHAGCRHTNRESAQLHEVHLHLKVITSA